MRNGDEWEVLDLDEKGEPVWCKIPNRKKYKAILVDSKGFENLVCQYGFRVDIRIRGVAPGCFYWRS